MKQIALALVILGSSFSLAQAQSESKYAKNYKVCRADDGTYTVCGDMNEDGLSANRVSSYEATRPVAVPAKPATVPCRDVYRAAYYPAERINYRYTRPESIRVEYEDIDGEPVKAPLKPAYGEPSPQYDGPRDNARRNLNYGSGQYVPPMDGTIR